MTQKRWFLGVSDIQNDLERNKNFLAKEINHYVFQNNWEGKELSLIAFKNRIFSAAEVEEAYALETGNVYDFQVKWEHLKQLITIHEGCR